MRPSRPPRVSGTTWKAAALGAAFLTFGFLVGVPGAGLQAQAPGGQDVQPVQVDSIAVEGNLRLSRPEIMASAGIAVESTITRQDIQEAIKNLWATGQYMDVEVLATGGGDPADPVVLTYRVEEQDLVRSVSIQGLENLDPQTVRDTAGLAVNEPYSPTRVEEAMRFIRQELSSEGIPFARIEERRESVPGAEKEIQLVLQVTEGNRVTVADVSFVGNETFDRNQLVGALETRPEGFWWFRTGSYETEAFQEDLEQRLPDFYRARGFLDFEIVDDTLIVDPQTGKARIELAVEEGPRYRITEFVVEGNEQFSDAQLRQYFEVEGGGILRSLGFGGGDGETGDPVFDQIRFQEATSEVQRLYNNNGYLYAQIQPFVEPLEEVPEDGAPRVRVGWEIAEGNPAYVDRVAIQGNDYTHERVIRDRILLLPGDVYSEARLLQSYQSIQSLGFFDTPMDPPDIQPNPETGDVDITFTVEEQQTGTMNFGTSVAGGYGLSGFIGYDHPNLFGQAKVGHLQWDFGRYINSFTASYSDPAIFGPRVSGSFSVFNSRDRFFSFRSGRRRRIGASAQFGIPVPGSQFSQALVGYSVARTKYDLNRGAEDTSLFGRADGTQSTVTLGLARSTLNHPLFPTQGSRQRISFELNGGPLGGDGDFVKQTVEGSWWVPVGGFGEGGLGAGGPQFALGLSLQAGAIYGDAGNFPFERFWLGGVQFGEEVRGYDETSITPFGYFPENSSAIPAVNRLGDAFLTMTAEYALRLNNNISISAFYDAGGIWRDPSEFNPSRLFRGAGIGLDVVTPFAPLGLDYAYGFDRNQPGWQFHFTFGGQ